MKIFKNILILLLLLFLFTGCSNKEDVYNNNSNTQRLSTNTNNNIANNATQLSDKENQLQNAVNEIIVPLNEAQTEEELSSFSTKLLTDDDDRENNIEITCSKINEYVVEPGDTFSFTNTVGKATHEKGYEEANVFDANGNTIKGLRWW